MMIYCAHKYGGEEKNKRDIEKKIKTLQLSRPKDCFISPVHCFGWMYKDIDYDAGMELCIDLLSVCDEVLVLSELSKGVKIEIETAEKLHIPVRYYQGMICKDCDQYKDGMCYCISDCSVKVYPEAECFFDVYEREKT